MKIKLHDCNNEPLEIEATEIVALSELKNQEYTKTKIMFVKGPAIFVKESIQEISLKRFKKQK